MRAKAATLSAGNEDNTSYSTIQLSLTRIEDENKAGLTKIGKRHIDTRDDARRISVVLFLHYFPEEYFPGRFNITSARLTCPTTIFGAFTFSGLQPHEENGAGWYPEDFSEELQEQRCNHSDHPAKLDESYDFKRIVAVSYPNNLLTEARFHKLDPALRNEGNLDSILPVAGTRLNHQEWLMRTHIKRNLATLDRSTLGAIEMVGMFSWQEGGVPHFPRLEIAQASLTWGGLDNKW